MILIDGTRTFDFTLTNKKRDILYIVDLWQRKSRASSHFIILNNNNQQKKTKAKPNLKEKEKKKRTTPVSH